MSIDIRRCADRSVSDRHGRRYSGLTGPIIAVLVLHETVTWIGVAGILLIISGMVLGTRQGTQKTPADAA